MSSTSLASTLARFGRERAFCRPTAAEWCRARARGGGDGVRPTRSACRWRRSASCASCRARARACSRWRSASCASSRTRARAGSEGALVLDDVRCTCASDPLIRADARTPGSVCARLCCLCPRCSWSTASKVKVPGDTCLAYFFLPVPLAGRGRGCLPGGQSSQLERGVSSQRHARACRRATAQKHPHWQQLALGLLCIVPFIIKLLPRRGARGRFARLVDEPPGCPPRRITLSQVCEPPDNGRARCDPEGPQQAA